MSTLALTLFGVSSPAVSASWRVTRTELDPCCWVDHSVGFLEGADALLIEMSHVMAWERGQRLMYGTWHDEPRRTALTSIATARVPRVIEEVRTALSEHYDRAFDGLFCNMYDSGRDSVAWHADRIGRTDVDPLVAIVSLGGPRDFHLRPQGGGPSHKQRLCSGDLLIMGGATQHHWEHAVPKVRQANPRMSVTMRAGGPRRSISGPGSEPRAATRRSRERLSRAPWQLEHRPQPPEARQAP